MPLKPELHLALGQFFGSAQRLTSTLATDPPADPEILADALAQLYFTLTCVTCLHPHYATAGPRAADLFLRKFQELTGMSDERIKECGIDLAQFRLPNPNDWPDEITDPEK